MNTALMVGAGGALGSMARYLTVAQIARVWGTAFPYGTLAVNLVGCSAMGVLAGVFAVWWAASQDMRVFLTTGFLGGFTTFSAFSLDVGLLVDQDRVPAAALYVLASVGFSIAGFFAGLRLVRLLGV